MMRRMLLAVSIAACATLSAGMARGQILDISPAARVALGIEVEDAQAAAAFAGAEASATVIAPPGRLHAVISPFDGMVIQPLVVPGMNVTAGQDIAIIYSQAYVDTEAELGSRRLMAEHRAELAGRADRLLAAGLVSASDAEEAHHDATEARLLYDAMRQQMAATHRDESGAGRFVLTATAAGVVAHLDAESGNAVEAGAAIVQIFSDGEYWARALAPERSADLLEIGSPVDIAGWGQPGEVVAIDPEVDAATRSLEVLVALPAGGPWRLGRILDLSFQADAPAGSVSVPSASVVRLGGADVAFVERNGGFAPVEVSVLARSRDRVLVSGGLQAGDGVAAAGTAALKNMAEGG